MLWLVLFIVVIGVAVYIVDKKIKVKFEDKFNPKDWDLPGSVELPVEPKPQLLAPVVAIAEKISYEKKSCALRHEQANLYKALHRALAGEYLLLANTNAGDVLAITTNNNALIMQVAEKTIATKKFDFLVCDSVQLMPVCAITVGDNLDPLLHNACESACLPVVLFRIELDYDIAVIRARILQAIRIDSSNNASNHSALDIVNIDILKPSAVKEEAVKQEEIKQESVKEEPTSGNGIELKICPNCAAIMLKRKAKSGDDAGKLFWICSTYPKCRGMLKIVSA